MTSSKSSGAKGAQRVATNTVGKKNTSQDELVRSNAVGTALKTDEQQVTNANLNFKNMSPNISTIIGAHPLLAQSILAKDLSFDQADGQQNMEQILAILQSKLKILNLAPNDSATQTNNLPSDDIREFLTSLPEKLSFLFINLNAMNYRELNSQMENMFKTILSQTSLQLAQSNLLATENQASLNCEQGAQAAELVNAEASAKAALEQQQKQLILQILLKIVGIVALFLIGVFAPSLIPVLVVAGVALAVSLGATISESNTVTSAIQQLCEGSMSEGAFDGLMSSVGSAEARDQQIESFAGDVIGEIEALVDVLIAGAAAVITGGNPVVLATVVIPMLVSAIKHIVDVGANIASQIDPNDQDAKNVQKYADYISKYISATHDIAILLGMAVTAIIVSVNPKFGNEDVDGKTNAQLIGDLFADVTTLIINIVLMKFVPADPASALKKDSDGLPNSEAKDTSEVKKSDDINPAESDGKLNADANVDNNNSAMNSDDEILDNDMSDATSIKETLKKRANKDRESIWNKIKKFLISKPRSGYFEDKGFSPENLKVLEKVIPQVVLLGSIVQAMQTAELSSSDIMRQIDTTQMEMLKNILSEIQTIAKNQQDVFNQDISYAQSMQQSDASTLTTLEQSFGTIDDAIIKTIDKEASLRDL